MNRNKQREVTMLPMEAMAFGTLMLSPAQSHVPWRNVVGIRRKSGVHN